MILVQVCWTSACNNLVMLNGRAGMDSGNGCFSWITTQGCSVVDYIIVSSLMLTMVKGFQANDPFPMSDPCSLTLWLATKYTNLEAQAK